MRSRLPERASWASASSRSAGRARQAIREPSRTLAAGLGRRLGPAPLLAQHLAGLPPGVLQEPAPAGPGGPGGPGGQAAARAYHLQPRAWLPEACLGHHPKAPAPAPLPRKHQARARAAAARLRRHTRHPAALAGTAVAQHSLQARLARVAHQRRGQASRQASSHPCMGLAASAASSGLPRAGGARGRRTGSAASAAGNSRHPWPRSSAAGRRERRRRRLGSSRSAPCQAQQLHTAHTSKRSEHAAAPQGGLAPVRRSAGRGGWEGLA